MSMMEKAVGQEESFDWLERAWFKLTGIERLTDKQAQIRTGSAQASRYWLVAAVSRRGGIVIDGQFCSLRAGGVWIGMAGQRVEWIDRDPEGQGAYVLRFLAGYAGEDSVEAEADGRRPDAAHPIAGEYRVLPPSAVADKCRVIERYRRSGNGADRLYGDAALYELLGTVLGSGLQGVAADLERVRQELAARFTEAVPVDQLADLAGLSRYHFMRLFKEKMGKSVGDYVTELRLNEAKRLMAERKELSLRDIAERVGYSNASYFSRQFKKWIDLSPSAYIRSRDRKVAAYSWPNIGQLLPLQIIPHAAPIDQFWNDCYRRKYEGDVAVLLSHDYEFNRQALWRARPDCIVALDCNMPDEEREKLERIAPVMLIPWEGTDWRGHLRVAAAYMNKPQEAEGWLSRYDRRAEQVRRVLPAALRERDTLILKVSGRRLLAAGRRAAAVFYEDLGVAFPAAGAGGDDWMRPVSAEQIAAWAAACIVVSVDEDAVSQSTWEQLRRSAAWRGLAAVREQAVLRLPGQSWFEFPWGEYSAFNHAQMLEELAAGALRAEGER